MGGSEDGGEVAGKVGEGGGEDGSAGVEDEVYWGGEEVEMGADEGAAAALDAVAGVGFAEGFGDGEADAGAGSFGAAGRGAEGEEVGEVLGGEAAGAGVGVLVVGVLAEAVELGHERVTAEAVRWMAERIAGGGTSECRVVRCAQDDGVKRASATAAAGTGMAETTLLVAGNGAASRGSLRRRRFCGGLWLGGG